MSIIGLVLNGLLVVLLLVAIVVGLRLSRRLKVLRDTHEGFAGAVVDLNRAAARAEQGLADLRAATDEATDMLAERIEKGRALAAKLERLIEAAPSRAEPRAEARLQRLLEEAPARADRAVPPPPEEMERRLGALLAAAREVRPSPSPVSPPLRREAASRLAVRTPDDELFDDDLELRRALGARR
jgi:hypothetical protein